MRLYAGPLTKLIRCQLHDYFALDCKQISDRARNRKPMLNKHEFLLY